MPAKSFVDRINNEKMGIAFASNEACQTCLFAYGEVMFNGKPLELTPSKCHCLVYEPDDSNGKPQEVAFDGAPCEWYEEGDDKPQSLLLGLAVGDALGVPVEFKKRGSFHVKDMQGFGSHNQPAGTWSDDTSLALALAKNLGPTEIYWNTLACAFVAWRDTGYLTAHGVAFDIGNATNRAIDKLKKGVEPRNAGGKDARDNGNGSLMRIAPLVFYMVGKQPSERYKITKEVSSVTHAHPISITACFIYIEFLFLLFKGRSKKAAYDELKEEFEHHKKFLDKGVLGYFERILKGNIAGLKENDIKSDGYVVNTLEASLWSFLTTKTYKDAVLKAVNLGDDTDTTGAVTGAMAGLHYGLKNIPQEWLGKLAKADVIRKIGIEMPRWRLPEFNANLT